MVEKVSDDELVALRKAYGRTGGDVSLLLDHIELLARELEEAKVWNRTRRWNIEEDGEDLLICRGDHDKHDACDYERFVPVSRLSRAVSGLELRGDHLEQGVAQPAAKAEE